MKRSGAASVESSLLTVGVLALVVLLLASVHAITAVDPKSIVVGAAGSGTAQELGGDTEGIAGTDGSEIAGTDGSGVAGSDSAGGAGGAKAGTSGGSGASGGAGASCSGGATDVGVKADSIKLGATVVDSGIGSSFLGPVRLGMVALQEKVNRAGGICGRKLNLVMKDDAWDRQRGRSFIQNLVEDEKIFALAVVPSSEGLDASADYITQNGIPVVGSDGMLVSQYTNEWIWPVATSTMSLMQIIAKDAHDRGARHFSLVYDRKYRFGLEGAYAFNNAVKRLTGHDVVGYKDPFSGSPKCEGRFCGISAGASSYNSEAKVLRDGCFPQDLGGGERCDFNALLLEPTEALTWYNSGAPPASSFGAGGHGAGAAQPLFTRGFADQCQAKCDELVVWTGFNPPIERFAGIPGVQQYVSDVKAQSSTADVNNQFLEGGYLGMQLLVEALEQLGPNVTRKGLQAALNSITLDTGLTQPLSWKGDKFANEAGQGFRINYTSSFGGWTEATRGWVTDPWVGQDLPKG
ncbi:MAG: ABC transporter substrate-binding protein [Actinomycetota bacterium]|nr:ABC transporter substrate-binding protein [Actinomycetota bacterium]